MNRRPKKEEPSDILTWLINSWVTGSWKVEVAVTRATTPDCAPMMTSFNWISYKPGLDWYVPVVLLKVNWSLTEIWVPYKGLSSCWDTAVVPDCALVTPRVVDSEPCVILLSKKISEPNW